MAGLFAAKTPSSAPEDDDSFDTDDDSKPVGDEDDGAPADAMAGPFEAYAETIFDAKATTAEKADALRQAILTVLEERGMGGGATPSPGLGAGLPPR